MSPRIDLSPPTLLVTAAVADFSQRGQSKIDEATAAGDLLPKLPGTPLDLGACFAAPAECRASLSVLKSHGCLPPEIEWRKRSERLGADLKEVTDPAEKSRLAAGLRSWKRSSG
ncbi:hypothetical protein Hsar01_02179 [Haloferula sargassicola]|uniref:Uncharacterized protein n=1 Tax=Haloferula sargassicola TaxID=490096 RepID=A0ABP9UMZ4_9BACT